ncbi:MAG: uracil-DNA glycosylase [Marinibacterium sp.]
MRDPARLGAWNDLPFLDDTLPAIATAINADPRDILPPRDQVLAALELCQPDATRVVILGQDPYPTPGHAHGLAFSTEPDVTPLPKSLGNIYREMTDDLGTAPPNGDLRFWARQGVLLLNTVLTVPAGEANGHKDLGWQALTAQVLARLIDEPRVFLLWGNAAQKLARDIHAPHFKIETSHPSPLSAHHSFYGSRPFSRTNAWLVDHGHTTINWTDPEAA